MRITLLCLLSLFANLDGSYVRDVFRFLDNYNRDFTVLVLGQNALNNGLSIAKGFPHSSVIIVTLEKNPKRIDLKNVCILAFELSYRHLVRMNECEHFDTTIYCDPNPSTVLVEALKPMSQHILLIDLNENNLHFWESKKNLMLKKRTLVWPPPDISTRPKKYEIIATFDEKFLKKSYTLSKNPDIEKTQWTNGINLVTFLFFNGIVPSRSYINSTLDRLKDDQSFIFHGDLTPANLVIAGETIKPIDMGNPKARHPNFEKLFDFLKEIIIKKELACNFQLFYDYYWKNLPR